MSDSKNKSKLVLHELTDLESLLNDQSGDDNVPTSQEVIDIPVLNETIPELNETIEELDNISITLNVEHTTETIEQQIARTHNEVQPTASALDATPDETINYEETITLFENDLNREQFDLEQTAIDQRNTPDDLITGENTDQENNNEADNPLINTQQNRELILKKAWIKLEMLLMDNMPVQITGTLLQLLDSKIEENNQQILDELSLMDELSFAALLEALDIDQGF